MSCKTPTPSTGPAAALRAVILTVPLVLALSCPAHAAINGGELISEEWMNILFNGRKIGFNYQKIEAEEHGYRITSRAVIRMKIMDVEQDMSFSQVSHLDDAKKLRKFVYLQTIRNQRQRTIGVVYGDKMRLTIRGAGGDSSTTIRIDPKTNFGDTLEFLLKGKLEVGMKMVAPVFIPSLRATERMEIAVVGKETITVQGKEYETLVVESSMQGVKSQAFVTRDGRKIREESYMGLTSEITTEDEALEFPAAYVPITSLITFSLITPDKPIEDSGEVTRLEIEVGGLDRPDLFPEDERQTTGESERVTGKERKRTFTTPVTIQSVAPVTTITLKQAARERPDNTRPSPEIQSDNKLIRRRAQDIIGGQTDAWKAARLINRWVFENIEKKFVDSFTAIDVLLAREGECQSHTNLFAALARSVGLPTRVAAGLVYSQNHNGFLYHAWPEVYVGGWVAMDPTLGQDVADATHLKLIQNGIENQVKLLRYIGKISISVKSVSED